MSASSAKDASDLILTYQTESAEHTLVGLGSFDSLRNLVVCIVMPTYQSLILRHPLQISQSH